MKHSTRRLLAVVVSLALAVFVPRAFSAQVNATAAKALMAIMQATPGIEYPVEARARHIGGRGLFDIWFRVGNGIVTRVIVLQTTGSKILDDAAVKGLSRWRAKPGKVSHMHVPVNFVL
jgi:TonB family protein